LASWASREAGLEGLQRRRGDQGAAADYGCWASKQNWAGGRKGERKKVLHFWKGVTKKMNSNMNLNSTNKTMHQYEYNKHEAIYLIWKNKYCFCFFFPVLYSLQRIKCWVIF
jgi:hypothetical protein